MAAVPAIAVLVAVSAILRVEVALMEGWCSVEELVRWGFGHAPVVMANEAHDGLTRCVRTREMGIRMIRAAHEAGVRRLAMEALPWPARGTQGPIQAVPPAGGGYLAQPDMRKLIAVALELGWTLWAYEAVFEVTADTDPAELLSIEFTNWREREQAANLCQLTAAAPGEPLLVWCGNSHASKAASNDWTPMGWQFSTMSGTDPFVIDQTATVSFRSQPWPWVQPLLAELSATLTAHDGTVGILRDQAPAPLDSRSVDAVVVSTENTLT
jgi:GAF domain-containing protein